MKYRDAEIALCGSLYYGNREDDIYHILGADRVADLVRQRAFELQVYLGNLSDRTDRRRRVFFVPRRFVTAEARRTCKDQN